jgi:PhnB protein
MSEANKTHRFTPEGWQTVTPRIVVDRVPQLVEFLRSVFDATGDYTPDRPTIMKIGSSMVMISEPVVRKPMPAFLYIYVDDADEKYRRAVDAGATSLEVPSNIPYGDRRGMVEDRWGNVWQIATYNGSESVDEG